VSPYGVEDQRPYRFVQFLGHPPDLAGKFSPVTRGVTKDDEPLTRFDGHIHTQEGFHSTFD
jgi:hypothetical protein